MPFLRTITAKITAIILINSLFIAVIAFAAYSFTRHIQNEAAKINLAGHLRFRLHEMSWEAHRIEKKGGRERRGVIEYLVEGIDNIDKIIDSLKNGNRDLNINPVSNPPESLAHLSNIFDKWSNAAKPFILALYDSRHNNILNKETTSLFSRLDISINNCVSEADSFVNSLQMHYKNEMKRLDRMKLLAVGIFALMFFF